MNQKQTHTFLLILLALTSVSLCVILLKPTKTQASAVVTPNSEAIKLDEVNKLKASFFNIYPSLVVPTEDKKIADTITLAGTDGRKLSLRTLAGNSPKLVFRYSRLDCELCIDSVLSIIKKIKGETKVPELIVIADFQNNRDFLIKDKHKKHPYPVYNIANGNLGLPVENKNLPFLFILSEDFKATKVFIPFKEVPYQTNEYINYAFNYLKQNN